MQALPLSRVPLGAERMAELLALSTEAGWNQVADDWSFMLANGVGYGFADESGRLVASGLTVEFPDYAWISMILVTPAWRRQGLATELMQLCVARLESAGLVPALDASPQGREVYLKLGFRDCGATTRLLGRLSSVAPAPGDISPMAETDLPAIAAFDAVSAGTDRAGLLRHLQQRLPQAGFVARRHGQVTGFVLARPGRQCAQIGPVVADDEETAIGLLAAAGASLDGMVCLDLFDQRHSIRRWLDGQDFRAVTTFARMVQGPSQLFPVEHRTMVMAGPELS